MKNTEQHIKSETALKEEKILEFWQENNIFQKTLDKESPKGDFVFYDGPPFATGLPHYGHMLPGTIKDIIPRYKTMRGYHVARKWGWDCHGLPIENLIEKELNLKTKKDIEDYGIEKFNTAARNSVLRYEQEWKDYVPRSGRFVDMDDPYMSMQPSYTESVWWVFSELYKKGLTFEGYKAMHLCPRCETTLANFEVNQGYKDVTDISVTAKFKLIDEPNTYFLAWTTTPWTLPGNVALAVGADIEYVKIAHEEKYYIVAKELAEKVFTGKTYEVIETIIGSKLVGTSYSPVFDYYQKQEDLEKRENGWKVYAADFVTTEDGTGIVHIAPAFGSDDLELSKQYQLPVIQHVARNGAFKDDFTTTQDGASFKGMQVKTKEDYTSADIEIIKVLAGDGLLFSKQKLIHSYPHCWRCDTPLLNYATTSWYVDVPKIKDDLIEANKNIHWVPQHVGEGRFGKWLEGAREWALSRSRFWGTPLPVWKSIDTEETFVPSSIDELMSRAHSSGNTYYGMRHGESESNIKGIINADIQIHNPITEKGRTETLKTVQSMKENNQPIDLIFVSPFQRTRETAEIVREVYGLDSDAIILDERLAEMFPGKAREGNSWHEAHVDEESQQPHNFWKYRLEEDAESIKDIYERSLSFLFDLENKYKNKNILIISHGGILKVMQFASIYHGNIQKLFEYYTKTPIPTNSEIVPLPFKPFPHNDEYALDVHRPYIDTLSIISLKGDVMKRVEDVFDVWFDSGSMPYAQVHYPFDAHEDFENNRFPADFISESLDQTRGWFYVLLVLGVALFGKSPFKNVVVGGLVLAEDGRKMSKSLRNYPDMHIVLNNQGADALRLFLMSSPLVRAEEHSFSEKGVQEVQSKVMGRLRNIVSFYELYQSETEHTADVSSPHTLDQWIIARLAESNRGITEYLEEYSFDKASKYIFDFVDDFSTWYIRRSRDRYKGDDPQDKEYALGTTRFILQETAKMIAPFTPFIAEEIWHTVRDVSMKESVHLEDWTVFEVQDTEDLIHHMARTREIISIGLQQRADKGIKVRQPLQQLKAPINGLPSEYFEFILEELNVKTLEDGEYELNTELNEQLIQEGIARELLRTIQSLRKEQNLEPSDRVALCISTTEEGKKIVQLFESELKRVAGISDIQFSFERQIKVYVIENIEFTLSLK